MSVRGAVGLVMLVLTLFCLFMLLFLGHLDVSLPRIALLNEDEVLAGIQPSQRGTQRTFPVQQTVSRKTVLPDTRVVSPRRAVSPNKTMADMEPMARSVEYEEDDINKEDRLSALKQGWEHYAGHDYGEEGVQFGNQSGLSGGPARRLTVVVFAQMRTGSSFTGEILNQNPSFWYMFEPLWHLHHQKGRATVRLTNVAHSKPTESVFSKVLGGILRCDFGQLIEFIGKKKLFFTRSDKALIRFCDEVLHWPPSRCAFVLRPQSLPKVVKYCKRTPHMAVKTIRIQDMNSLEYLLSDPTLDLRIIHLDVPSPWRGRYILVRYEDLAEHPELMTKKLYDFLGVPLDDTVLRWVRENTKGDGKPHGRFSTTHHDANDANATTKSWRFRLSFPAVAKVQEMCRDAMKIVGYKEVDSSEALRDLQTSVVDKIPDTVIAIRP